MSLVSVFSNFFFFNDTATTEIYTLSLHDALPIYPDRVVEPPRGRPGGAARGCPARRPARRARRVPGRGPGAGRPFAEEPGRLRRRLALPHRRRVETPRGER